MMLRSAVGGRLRGLASCCGAPAAARGLPALHGRRSFSVEADGEAQQQKRRVWRWGGSAGIMGKEEDAEVSKEPALIEDVRGVGLAACGSLHSAFVVDGKLFTYGSNKYNQLGRQLTGGGSSPDPAEVSFGATDVGEVTQVSLGAYHSAAITAGGNLWTWGWGGSFWYGAGALGHGNKDAAEVPLQVQRFGAEGDEEVAQVACGAQHTIVLTKEGRIYSTGKGDFGRLGRGDTRDELEFEEIDYFYEANDSVLAPDQPTVIVKVAAGNNFSAAMSSSGELWVWGRNDHGQLGLGEEAMGDMYSAERYPRLVRSLPAEGHKIVDFACGEHHLVVLTEEGVLYEWGARTWLEPHAVSIPDQYKDVLKNVTKLAAGEKFSFALASNGTLFSWGSKSSGCLAQGADCPKTIVEPTPVPSSTFGHQKVVDVVASKSRCLAITAEDEYSA
mmetsp:Transcript_79939/g.202253  ORF Transcript_79939/g.202253 Transcript_79939/m.202253 type:complete len:444 (-) Transcript_79939:1-1332(-)